MKLLVTVFICLFLFIFPANEKITWQENRKLTWADFKAEQKPQNDFVASTSSGISFSYSFTFSEGKMQYETSVSSNFYPLESWYNPKEVTPYILQHEQVHFDISELHARILKKSIQAFSFSKNIKNEMNALYNKTEISRRAMQDKFDFETNHSKNHEKEKQWETFVAQQLKAYEKWR